MVLTLSCEKDKLEKPMNKAVNKRDLKVFIKQILDFETHKSLAEANL